MSRIVLKYIAFVIIFNLFQTFISFLTCTGEKIRYISTEHPNVTYIDHVNILYANLTSERYGRSSPIYYVGLHMDVTMPLDNDFKVDFYFYEYLTNVYKRGFIEMHFTFCQLMNDNFFGAPMRQGKLAGPCPYPPGIYNLYNMSIDVRVIPKSFPFTKGRIYANCTYKKKYIAGGYIDMEIKEITIRKRKKTFKLTHVP